MPARDNTRTVDEDSEPMLTTSQLTALATLVQQVDAAIDVCSGEYATEHFHASFLLAGVEVRLERADNIVKARIV